MEAVTRDPELGYRAKGGTRVGWPIAFRRKDIFNQWCSPISRKFGGDPGTAILNERFPPNLSELSMLSLLHLSWRKGG